MYMFVHPGASPREEDAERQASCGRRALAGSARYCQPAAGAPRGRGDIGSGTFRIYSSRDYGGGGRDGERGGTVGSDSDISEKGGGAWGCGRHPHAEHVNTFLLQASFERSGIKRPIPSVRKKVRKGQEQRSLKKISCEK